MPALLFADLLEELLANVFPAAPTLPPWWTVLAIYLPPLVSSPCQSNVSLILLICKVNRSKNTSLARDEPGITGFFYCKDKKAEQPIKQQAYFGYNS